MLPGFSGHLISESFLERHLAEDAGIAPQSFVGGLREWRRRCLPLGPASSVRTLFESGAGPFARALGFADPTGVAAEDRVITAVIETAGQRVGLLVAPWGDRLDALWRPAVVHARARHAAWCVLFNGTHARIVDASRTYSRRFAQFDLDVSLDDDRTVAALRRVLGADGPRDLLVAASEAHAVEVCRSLRDGVLRASADVLGALVPSRRPVALAASFEQALTIVYRILFLLFAEARRLVPVWHPVYRDSYSLDALRRAAERHDHTPGLWDALRAVSRLAHAGCHAGDLRVTPFNGRLFAPSRTPLADRHDLDDAAARRALLGLTTRKSPDGAGRELIAYRDLGVEQLGAVYETLLDYTPAISPDRARTVSLNPGSGLRKSTGTFYTPQPIAEYVVRRTLGPLVRDRTPEQILALRVVDPAMGSGAFLVAAAAYLGHAYEAALVRQGGYHASDFGDAEHATVRRMVAERCLFGVDLNPMAVQLARLSLWLATLAGDRPLSFLDHHLIAGDSLLGAWLDALRRPPVRRRHREEGALPLFDDAAVTDALRHALPVRFTLGSEPSDTIDQVRAKERALAALNRRDTALSKWKRVADLWCASWFADSEPLPPAAFAVLTDAILSGRCELPPEVANRRLDESAAVAAAKRFVHWELEFPEVFFDATGQKLPASGFDAVLGNPPWDMVRADGGWREPRESARQAVRFTRDAGCYTAQSEGHTNRYQLFVERAVALTRPGGRIGLVLPSGLAVDHGSARLRRMLFDRCNVDALVGFDNRDGVFPIHRSVRFLLVTATAGESTRQINCRLGERNPTVLETSDDDAAWFPVRVTPSLLQKLSGDGLAIPQLTRPMDVAIAEKAASLFPSLASDAGWAVRFGRELNATDDRSCFQPVGRGLPIVEGKHLAPFRVNRGGVRWSVSAKDAAARLRGRHERPRLAYRDVASATNRTTLIAAVLPGRCVTTHTVFCLRTPLPLAAQHFLCGMFNSLVVNYLVRLRVGTHVTTAIVERLPIPRESDAPGVYRELAAIARLLARGSLGDSMEQTARLNALVARLYQLTRDEFQHVLSSFPLVAREEREAALREFNRST